MECVVGSNPDLCLILFNFVDIFPCFEIPTSRQSPYMKSAQHSLNVLCAVNLNTKIILT